MEIDDDMVRRGARLLLPAGPHVLQDSGHDLGDLLPHRLKRDIYLGLEKDD